MKPRITLTTVTTSMLPFHLKKTHEQQKQTKTSHKTLRYACAWLPATWTSTDFPFSLNSSFSDFIPVITSQVTTALQVSSDFTPSPHPSKTFRNIKWLLLKQGLYIHTSVCLQIFTLPALLNFWYKVQYSYLCSRINLLVYQFHMKSLTTFLWPWPWLHNPART